MKENLYIKSLRGSVLEHNRPPHKSCAQAGAINLHGTIQGEQRATFAMSSESLSTHTLLLGGSGSGKTNVIFQMVAQIQNNLTQDDVLVIFDTKGDFQKEFATSDSAVLGVSKQYQQTSVRWNLFKELLADGFEETDYILNIREFCKQLFAQRLKNTTNAFFPEAASDVLECILIAFIRDTLGDKTLMNERLFNRYFNEVLFSMSAQRMIENLNAYPDLAYAVDYISGKNAQAQGVLSELWSVLKEMFFSVFAEKGAFSMREFVRNRGGKTLFLEYDLSIGNVLAPGYSVLIDLALKEALKQNHAGGNVYLVLDEFSLLPNQLQHLNEALAFGRSCGLKLIIGMQNINQAAFGDTQQTNALAGCATLVAFHNSDPVSRDFVTKRFGESYILENYEGADGKMQQAKRIAKIVADWDIIALQQGRAIVSLPYEEPFFFHFDLYKKMPK